MNKNDLIRKIAAKQDRSVADVRQVIEGFLDETMKAVGQDEKSVHLVGFGKFTLLTRKARKGRNPQTGEVIDLAASTRISFTPGSLFKRFLDKTRQL